MVCEDPYFILDYNTYFFTYFVSILFHVVPWAFLQFSVQLMYACRVTVLQLCRILSGFLFHSGVVSSNRTLALLNFLVLVILTLLEFSTCLEMWDLFIFKCKFYKVEK